ncbi:MAG: TenA family transcriptional regulator [Verrucomicrobium sp.]
MSAGSIGSPVDHPAPVAAAPQILAAARAVLDSRPIITQEYFTRLKSGALSRPEFEHSQQQFFFAVRFFSRAIAVVVARCPDSSMRMSLVENLVEEQGSFMPLRAHDRTFTEFLKTLDADTHEGRPLIEGPEVQAFNFALLGICQGADLETAFGCLGIIELAFAEISTLIGAAVVNHGWVGREKLVHYTLHAELDLRHAEECFSAVESRWADSPRARTRIRQGLRLGRHIFSKLYTDLVALEPRQAS